MKNKKDDQLPTDDDVENPMAKLEEALVICKFGRFHVKLMFTSLISVFATTSVTTATSYILPSAECDLNMTMMQKGLLNAIPFLGQVLAAVVTGFVTAAFGRKIFLVGGNFCMFILCVLAGSSQTYWMLLFVKLLDGMVMSFSFTATATMVAEFTHKNVRDRVLLLYSAFMSTSIIMAALLAWAILPRTWDVVVVKGYFELHSWNIYLYANSVWSIIAAILYWQIPESPKFLLSQGQENVALDVLKSIYKTNTGKEKETFPMNSLNISGIFTPTVKISLKKQMTEALFELKAIYRKPHCLRLVLFSTMTFVCLLAYSGLRLWYPQLSTIIENYQNDHSGDTARFCVILDDYNQRFVVDARVNIENKTEICVPQISGTETYTNGIILGFVSLICLGISGYLVDLFGQKRLMFIFLLLCSICSGSLYWTNSSIQIAILVSATCGFIQTAFSLQHNIVTRVFPTSIRTLALSLVIMIGRIGSLIGNILFPLMLEFGCMAPFITLSLATFCVAGLVYFLPNPNTENNGTGDK